MAKREEFVARSLHLLSLERGAELEESENASCYSALSGLAISSQKVWDRSVCPTTSVITNTVAGGTLWEARFDV